MKLTKNEVSHVARLGRLELSVEENEQFTSQLGSILNYIDQLEELSTQNILPTSYAVLENTNKEIVGREDICKQISDEQRENLLNNAPHRDGNFFRVKKVIDND